MRPRCVNGCTPAERGELTLRLIVTIGDHREVGLTVASVVMVLIDELQACSVLVRRVECSLEGPIPVPERRE